MKALAKILLVLAGLAALGWFLSRMNFRDLGHALAQLGWRAPVLLLPYLGVYVVDSAGWWCSFPQAPGVSFLRLFRIRWAGEAVNQVVPSAYVGGEAVKVYLLSKHRVPVRVSGPVAVISKTVQTCGQLVFIALASLAFVSLGHTPPTFQRAMAAVVVAGAGIVVGMVWVQRRGVFFILFELLARLPLPVAALEQRREQLLRLDAPIHSCYAAARWRLLLAFAGYLGGWLLDTVEIRLAAYLLHVPLTWVQAVAIEGFVGVVRVIGLVVPAAIGVQESGLLFLCRMAGVPEGFAVVYAVLRRGREAVFALVGWKWLLLEGVRIRGLGPRVRDVVEG
jgi:hypothetical protein